MKRFDGLRVGVVGVSQQVVDQIEAMARSGLTPQELYRTPISENRPDSEIMAELFGAPALKGVVEKSIEGEVVDDKDDKKED